MSENVNKSKMFNFETVQFLIDIGKSRRRGK